MFNKSRLLPALLLVVLLIPFSAHCNEEIRLQLRWQHGGQFAGYYMAKEKGFYSAEDLDVAFIEGGLGVNHIEQVVKGQAHFGVAGSELVIDYLNGAPVQSLAVIYQHSPYAIMVRADSAINNPQQLAEKRIYLGLLPRTAEIQAMFINEGVNLENLVLVDPLTTTPDFDDPTVDAYSVYQTNEPYYLKQNGVQIKLIKPIEYGIDFYGDCLFSNKKMLKNNPKQTEQFLRASLKGWKYAFDNPEETIKVILEKYNSEDISEDHLRYELKTMRTFLVPELIPLGLQSIDRWRRIAETYKKLKMAPDDREMYGFIYDPRQEKENAIIRIKNFSLFSLLIFSTLAILLLIWNRSLKVKVSSKTKFLNQELLDHKTTRAQLEEALQKYKTLFYSFPAGIAVTDSTGIIVETNDTAQHLLGVNKSDYENRKIDGLEWKIIRLDGSDMPPEEWPSVIALKENRTIAKIEIGFVKLDGEVIWLNVSATPLPLDNYGVVVTYNDVTEQKKNEEKLQQALKMESIGNLAGGIAHDFNNILSSIIGFTELALEAAPKGSAQRDDLEEVHIAGNRAKELVQQILAFARQTEKETKPVRLSDVVTETLKLLRPSTPINIDIIPNINSTAKVMGNTSQLHQVVMNLCTNAIHSLQKTGGLLEIGLKNTLVTNGSELKTLELPSGEYVELTITDNGSGIHSAVIEKIFEPYFTTKGVGEGSGMGLAMVKGIIESYGGDIAVKSEQGKMTTFIIRLPIATGRSDTEKAQVASFVSGTERILFVDDEPPIARMGSRMLESLGYTVTMRTSSYEALELFREKSDGFDLVITDMTMPSMTGDDLSIELRKIRHDIPIILCTGYSNKIDDEGAKLIGIDAFAYKPFTKPDFAKTIREVLDKKRISSD